MCQRATSPYKTLLLTPGLVWGRLLGVGFLLAPHPCLQEAKRRAAGALDFAPAGPGGLLGALFPASQLTGVTSGRKRALFVDQLHKPSHLAWLQLCDALEGSAGRVGAVTQGALLIGRLFLILNRASK